MKIGIIGAGNIAQTVGKAWNAAGHEVMISSRNPNSLAELANQLNVDYGSVTDAAKYGDVILLAVNFASVDEAVSEISHHTNGKLVIDATNPLVLNDSGDIERVIDCSQISGELMQAKLPSARVGKAFTTLWTGHLETQAFANPKIAMTFAVDDSNDRETIASLIEDVGFEPVDLGTLSQSRPLDPPSPIWNVVFTAAELEKQVQEFRYQ